MRRIKETLNQKEKYIQGKKSANRLHWNSIDTEIGARKPIQTNSYESRISNLENQTRGNQVSSNSLSQQKKKLNHHLKPQKSHSTFNANKYPVADPKVIDNASFLRRPSINYENNLLKKRK